MKKLLKWMGIIFVVTMIIGVIGETHAKVQKPTSTTVEKTDKMLYVLKPHELIVLNAFLKDEVSGFSKGYKAFLIPVPAISAIEIEKAYNANQVAADQKYYEKNIFLKAKVASINSGLGNEPYIVLRSNNMFMGPQAHFVDGTVEKIASLKKGQQLNLVCEGNGAIAGTAMFKNCQFANDYADQKIVEVRQEIANFLEGEKGNSKEVQVFTIMAIAQARALPDSSPCFTDESKCMAAYKNVKKDVLKKQMSIVIAELKPLGIEVPDFLGSNS